MRVVLPSLQDPLLALRIHAKGVPSSVMMVGVRSVYWLLESRIS